jgi:hypothetical protein
MKGGDLRSASGQRTSGFFEGKTTKKSHLLANSYLLPISIFFRDLFPIDLETTSTLAFFFASLSMVECKALECKKKVIDFSVPSRDVTYQTFPGRE